MMSSTVVVRGAGGAIFEMDVPASGHALDRWNEQLAKGDLVIIEDEVQWVDVGDGIRQLRPVEKSTEPATRQRTKKADAAKTDAPTDDEE